MNSKVFIAMVNQANIGNTVIRSQLGQRGFTIVELLIVIVVIGILAAITIVGYTGITSNANQKAALHNATAVRDAALTYYAENGSYPAVASSTISGGTYSKLAPTILVNSAGPITAGSNNILYGVKASNGGVCIGYFPVGGAYTVIAGGGATGTMTNVASPTCT